MILFLTCMLLLTGYYLLIAFYHQAWTTVPLFETEPGSLTNPEKISVIIPARNEEANIEQCLQSLLQQDYPKALIEIIVVDDHSTDATSTIVRQYQKHGVLLVDLEQVLKNQPGITAYKKKAIEAGIAVSTGSLIVTTDADCTAGSQWISTVATFRQKQQSTFIAAPVKVNYYNTVLSIFQSMDFAILQGITGASVSRNTHNMCNGANLAYEKKAFYKVNGFAGIDNIASGDDMLLMRKIKAVFPHGVHYLKSAAAIVATEPAANWRAFFQQRIRWASKTRDYKEPTIVAVLVSVYLLNLSLFILLVGSIFQPQWLLFFCIGVFYKTIIEWAFVQSVLRYFNSSHLMRFFPLLQPLHITYTVIAGFLGSISKYEWKGRKVK